MLLNILFAVGALLILGGILQFRKAIQDRLSSKMRHSPYGYDRFPAKRKLTPNIFLLIIFAFAGLILLMLGFWIKYSPRGNSLFQSVNIDGISTENDNIEYSQNQENHTTEYYESLYDNRYSFFIIVSGKTIIINETEIGGTEEFEEYLKKMDRVQTILLVDDYAVSSTYHKVEELLDAYSMKYETESEE